MLRKVQVDQPKTYSCVFSDADAYDGRMTALKMLEKWNYYIIKALKTTNSPRVMGQPKTLGQTGTDFAKPNWITSIAGVMPLIRGTTALTVVKC